MAKEQLPWNAIEKRRQLAMGYYGVGTVEEVYVELFRYGKITKKECVEKLEERLLCRRITKEAYNDLMEEVSKIKERKSEEKFKKRAQKISKGKEESEQGPGMY